MYVQRVKIPLHRSAPMQRKKVVRYCEISCGVPEFLGFHFNGRWKKPRDKALKKFKSEVKQRTRRRQPISLGTLIKLLNPKIRGWRNYFEGCTKKRIFKELDEYIMERLRYFKAKSRSNKVLWYFFMICAAYKIVSWRSS